MNFTIFYLKLVDGLVSLNKNNDLAMYGFIIAVFSVFALTYLISFRKPKSTFQKYTLNKKKNRKPRGNSNTPKIKKPPKLSDLDSARYTHDVPITAVVPESTQSTSIEEDFRDDEYWIPVKPKRNVTTKSKSQEIKETRQNIIKPPCGDILNAKQEEVPKIQKIDTEQSQASSINTTLVEEKVHIPDPHFTQLIIEEDVQKKCPIVIENTPKITQESSSSPVTSSSDDFELIDLTKSSSSASSDHQLTEQQQVIISTPDLDIADDDDDDNEDDDDIEPISKTSGASRKKNKRKQKRIVAQLQEAANISIDDNDDNSAAIVHDNDDDNQIHTILKQSTVMKHKSYIRKRRTRKDD